VSILGVDIAALDEEILFSGTDLVTVTAIDNLKQALYHRLIADKGELVHHPEYGSEIYKYVGKPMTPGNISDIQNEVAQCVLQDPRVEGVLSVEVEVITKAILVYLTFKAIEIQVPINVVFPFSEVIEGV